MASRLHKKVETDNFNIVDHGTSIPLPHRRRLAKPGELGGFSKSGLIYPPRRLLEAHESEE